MKRDVIILLGPTAVGKTTLSIHLSKLINAEILSADSRLVYRGLDIGTAKPSMDERGGIPHHLIDIVNPDQEFTVADFQTSAFKIIEEIHDRGKNTLVAGGTGLYIRALVDNPSYQDLPPDPELRDKILDDIERSGVDSVFKELSDFDPVAAENIHPNNIPRLVRAVEVIRSTGKKFSDVIKSDAERAGSNFHWRLFGLNMDRELLYDRINRRVDEMIKAGWEKEVRRVLSDGCSGDEKPLKGLGYRDMIAYIRGEKSLNDAIELIKRDTRRFAKRQMTYFRGLDGVRWIDLDENSDPVQVAESILTKIRDSMTC